MKDAKTPNIKGPRFRRSEKDILDLAYYNKMIEKYPNLAKYSHWEIKKLIGSFNRYLWELVVEKRDGIELPEMLGHIFIGSCHKKKKPTVDFKTSAEQAKVIEFRNWESDQYLAKIFFTSFTSKYRYLNHDLWGFKPAQQFSRYVGKYYPDNYKKYVVVDPKLKINSQFSNNFNRSLKDDYDKEALTKYNEFESW